MKTFGCLAALVGLTIGFASAGPVAVNDGSGSSMCEIKCGAQNKFKYAPGKTYVYKYSTKTETALEQSSDEKSTIYLDADISLHVMDSCRFALKIDSAKLDEEISGGGRKASRGTQELAESLTKNPLIFNYEDGTVSRLCPAQQESKSALNIKRGILSMIQNKMADLSKSDVTFEGDVNGDCRAVYTTQKGWGGMRILKEKTLSECRRANEQQVTSVLALPRQVAKSSSMINGTQECQQTIKNSIFDTVECHERHVVKPFSRQERGAATEIHQTLKFQRSGGDVPANQLRYTEGEMETLQFDPTHYAELQNSQAEGRARALLQQLTHEKHSDVKAMNEEFMQLTEALRKMRYDTLNKLEMEFKNSQPFVDAVLSTQTRDSMKLAAELVKSRVVSTESAKHWLLMVSLTTDVDIPRIQMLLPLLDNEGVTMAAHLAVSSLARKYMEENSSEVPEEITNLMSKLYSQLRSEASDMQMMATIKAIGNIGISTGQERMLIEATNGRPTEIRLAAVEAFRRFPCDSVKRDQLMSIFSRSSEDIEVRIGAYLNSIFCPTEEMIATVKNTLLKEQRGSELTSFVFTHLKNLEKRSSFNEDLSLITSDERLKSLELDSKSFSKNFYYEMFFNPLDMGFEVDASVVMTDQIANVMLNTTVDIFGTKANIFDARARAQKNMARTDIFVRLFGHEVFSRSGAEQSRDVETLLKSVMSRNGWKYSRSMLLLDTEMYIATGTGLPLVVGVNGTGTVDIDLKAMPLQGQQGSKYVAEIRSAPSVAMQFGVSMMMKAPQTNSGIKMVVTSSSQWDLNGRVNVDLTDSRMMRNIQIDAPRDRSDIIDIKSDVYLVGANSEREIKATGTNQKHVEMCTGKPLHDLVGHKACLEATYPQATGDSAPFFMLRGPSRFNVRWEKTDRSLKMFHVQNTFAYGQKELIELAFEMDTPGSEVKRQFKGRLYADRRSQNFGLDMISPQKSFNLEGSYKETGNSGRTELVVKVDGKPEMTMIGKVESSTGRATITKPSLEVTFQDRQILNIHSEIVSQGNQKFNGDATIQSIFHKQPIKLTGEYAVLTNSKRLSFGLDSEYMKTNMQSIVQLQDRTWEVTARGDYSYNKGSKHTFGVGGKFTDDGSAVSGELSVKRNEKTFVFGGAKLNKSLPPNVDLVLELLGGRFKSSLNLQSEQSKAELAVMATIDNEKYQTQIKFNQAPRLTSLSAMLGLPNNVDRKFNLQYDLASPVKRLAVNTDLTGKPYSAKVAYTPSEKLHKVSVSAKMDKESVQMTATLATDPVYQSSVDILQNGAKLLSASVGVNPDMSKPDVKVYIQLRQQPLLDLATDTRVERESVNVALKMLAPIEVNANVGLKKSGSISDSLSLGAEIEVSSPDRMMNMALSSSGEISLWQRNKKLNLQTSVKLPGGTSEIVFNNVVDASSWSIDYSFQGPDKTKQHVQSSGTYNFGSPKYHLRGGLDMFIRAFDRQVKVESLAVDTELSLHEDELDFKTEIAEKNGKTLFLIAVNGGHRGQVSHAGFELNVMDIPCHLKLALDGNDLSSGWRATLDGKYHEESVNAIGNLRWDGRFIFANMDLQSSFKEFAKTSFLLQTQAFTKDNILLNAEYALGPHFAKAEVVFSPKSLEANVRTSIPDWQNVKAQGTWELEPKMRVTVNFSSVKYSNNVIEIELDRQSGVSAKLRVAVPSVHNGNLLDGTLSFSNGQGLVNVLHKGRQAAKLNFVLRNEEIAKNLSGDLSYNLNGVSDRWNFEVGVESTADQLFDAKLSLRKNSKIIVDVSYMGALNIMEGFYLQNRIEIQTVNPFGTSQALQTVYFNNKVILNRQGIQTQHELGPSPKEIRYSMNANGQLINDNDIFVIGGKFDGQWEQVLKGSVFAEFKTDRKNVIQYASRVESDRAVVCSSRFSLIRRERLVDLEAAWSIPKMHHETSLTMKSGIEEPETFVFWTKLERNQDAEKSFVVSLKLPLQTKNIDGHLRIKMPQELGGQSFSGNLLSKNSMFNANAGLSMGQGRLGYFGELFSQWDQDFELQGLLQKDGTNMAKAILKASLKRQGTFDLSAEARHQGVQYTTKAKGSWTQNKGDMSMDAGSSQWDRKHTISGSYSLDSKTGSLKIDVAKLKVNINSQMSRNLRVQGSAHFDNQAIADVTLNYNPNTKQGNVEATMSKQRMTSSFIARKNNGEFKLDLPSGASSLNWNLDQSQKMSLSGLWTFHSQNWRLEAYLDPRQNFEAEAKLYYKEEAVGSLYALASPEQTVFRFHLDHSGKRHSAELMLSNREGTLSGALKVNCPWLKLEPLDSNLIVEYTGPRRVFTFTNKIGSQEYSIKVNAALEGKLIKGTLKTITPYPETTLEATLDGTFSNEAFKVNLNSNKQKAAIEIDGMSNEEKMGFRVVANGLGGLKEVGAVVYYAEKYGFEAILKMDRDYEIIALAENHKSLKIAVHIPQHGVTGLEMKITTPGNYAVEGTLLGKQILQAKWTGSPNDMRSGVFDGALDLGSTVGKHSVIVTYNFVNTPSLKVQVDGQVIFDGKFEQGSHRVAGKWTIKFSKGGDLTVELKHQLSRDSLLSSFRISQNDKSLGYEARLNKDVHGSMLRLDTPKRSLLVELDQQQARGQISGRVAWDHGRDSKKSVEFSMSQQNSAQYGRKEQHLTLSFPKLGEKMVIRIAETDEGHQIETLEDQRSARTPRLSMMYSRQGKVKITLGHLMMQAQLSAKKTELIVRRASAQEDDVSIGYGVQGNTLSARLHWTPRLLANYELTAKKMLEEVRRGSDSKQGKQLSSIYGFISDEIEIIRDDINVMWLDLEERYAEDAWHMRSFVESFANIRDRVSQYFGSVGEKMREMIQDLKWIWTRYTQRLAVASTVVGAIQQELTEDFIDSLERWLSGVERSIQNETLRKIVERVIRYVKQDYQMIVDAVEHAFDGYVCELSSEQTQLTNKRCGFAFELNSHNSQQGLTMRLPVSVMQS